MIFKFSGEQRMEILNSKDLNRYSELIKAYQDYQDWMNAQVTELDAKNMELEGRLIKLTKEKDKEIEEKNARIEELRDDLDYVGSEDPYKTNEDLYLDLKHVDGCFVPNCTCGVMKLFEAVGGDYEKHIEICRLRGDF